MSTPRRVTDINPAPFYGSYPIQLIGVGSTLFFRARDSSSGTELWKTDGITTSRVADINPGSASSNPLNTPPGAVVGGTLFFTATDGSSGFELWKSDGVTTSRVADLHPGSGSSDPYVLTSVGNTLFFSANDPVAGQELWKTDGVTTSRVTDIVPGVASTFPIPLTAVGNTLYFRVNTTFGAALWKTDGTTTTRIDFRPAPYGSSPAALAAVGSTLFYSANDGSTGTELWKFDGKTHALVADIRPGNQFASSFPRYLTALGSTLFFSALDDSGGYELWKSDGTSSGTVRVADVRPGSLGSEPRDLRAVGSKLFFTADDGSSGRELWKTDGTTTSRVADIRPGSASSSIANLTVAGSTLYFTADDGSTGEELWKTDDTSTSRVADIRPFGGSNPRYLTVAGNTLYFKANDGSSGTEIWALDVTPPDALPVITLAIAPASVAENGTNNLVHTFRRTGSTAAPLVVNFSVGGTATLGSDYTQSGATSFSATAGTLTFAAGSETATISIDPTADSTVEPDESVLLTLTAGSGYTIGTLSAVSATISNDDAPPSAPSFSAITLQGSQLILRFSKAIVTTGLTNARFSVTVDGSSRAITAVAPVSGDPTRLSVTLAGTAPSASQAISLSYSDLSAANDGSGVIQDGDGNDVASFTAPLNSSTPQSLPRRVLDINPGSGSSTVASNLPDSAFSPLTMTTVVGGVVYFGASDASSGFELWRSDGSSSGTRRVADLGPGSFGSNISCLTSVGSTVYFSAVDASSTGSGELWRSDGSSGGTRLVADLYPGGLFKQSGPRYLTAVGTTLYFSAQDSSGRELWKSDGTSAGSVRVADLNPLTGSSDPRKLTAMGSTLYFTASNGVNGRELWRSDGTRAGTRLVADIRPGSSNSDPNELVVVGNTLYFAATSADGIELWKSDGTSAGTVQVADLRAGFSSFPRFLSAIGNTLYFTADDGVNGIELWKSDGTSAGTVRVADINPGLGGSAIDNMVVVGSTLFFTADDGSSGQELWKSDGTSAGTVRVADINPGSGSAFPLVQFSTYRASYLTALDNTLYFSATDGSSGRELWKSDGTRAGTVRVGDINPGSASSSPGRLKAAADGSTLFFFADDGTSGRELWALDLEVTLPTLAIAPASADKPEGLSGVKAFTFTVTRSGDTSADSAATWAVKGLGTNPVDATDFPLGVLPSGIVRFGSGEAARTITVNIQADRVQEAAERFRITLSDPVGATITTASASGIIRNDDFIGTTASDTLTGTAFNDYLYGSSGADTLVGNGGHDRLDGGSGADVLSGGAGKDSFSFRFSHSSLAAPDRITDFAIGVDKIDLLSSSGAARPAPGTFSRAGDNAATGMASIVSSVFTDANGATAGKQALGTDSAALVVATAPAIAGTYLVINDGVTGFQATNDLVIRITGFAGSLPAIGSISVGAWFS